MDSIVTTKYPEGDELDKCPSCDGLDTITQATPFNGLCFECQAELRQLRCAYCKKVCWAARGIEVCKECVTEHNLVDCPNCEGTAEWGEHYGRFCYVCRLEEHSRPGKIPQGLAVELSLLGESGTPISLPKICEARKNHGIDYKRAYRTARAKAKRDHACANR